MYIFLDESGKPEVYSSRGSNLVEAGTATRHLVIASVKTADQLTIQRKVTEFKVELLKDNNLTKSFSASYALDSFHAKNDYPVIRNKFYSFIANLEDIEIHVIVADKLACSETLKKNPTKMYGLLAGLNLHGISHQDPIAEIIFSRQDNGRKLREELELEVERIREAEWALHTKKPIHNTLLRYQHNPHYSHGGLQIADYVAYAVFQFFEKGNAEYISIIKDKIRHIHDYKTKKHFTRSRPLKLS